MCKLELLCKYSQKYGEEKKLKFIYSSNWFYGGDRNILGGHKYLVWSPKSLDLGAPSVSMLDFNKNRDRIPPLRGAMGVFVLEVQTHNTPLPPIKGGVRDRIPPLRGG